MVQSDPLPRSLMMTIRTRVTAEQYEQLQAMAKEDCSNLSHIVRRMVLQQLRATRVLEEQVSHGAA